MHDDGSQTRRTARDEDGRGGVVYAANHPPAVAGGSAAGDPNWKNAGGEAVRSDPLSRDSPMNADRPAASWQPSVDATC
jgi:hypothetical protein